ncbi:PREDICTED: protein WEAK CHLOROPLAST MOVEMENT UNDER BLUE LIGHT-like 2 [Camelina sativa]|uniref:Protein WEAK CHLOROPLAST MOVEMENT UNDER BLUE LIGHT-like 2 n=1 Tax=Camelina sativa TaxID=90675 RepID=A0ABM0VV19_CAMSA|nr:PREDICTED: protein WEAK CHLOROPLAST MOVEMENT UNDER BLUE LIGHT-like 2 [Camelina sativa]XP_010461500.1 PREDICTED: protein WEAK CHLOROPLAST MOVEMENT UNDER BLUE LIGHT-like 2 [Camelina sativa]
MMDDDKVSNELCLFPDLNVHNVHTSTPFGSIVFDSSICDLLNLEDGGDTPNLIPEHNPFFDSVDGHQEAESSPKVYIAPRVMTNHQDSFSLDSRVDDYIEDARILPGSPGGIQDLDLTRLRVPGSPRAFGHPRSSGSPRFGSPTSPILIDTAAPFESVKEAVSKFGGITDWKAHKIQTIERRKTVDQELEKIQEDMPEYKKQAVVAEEVKQQVVMELERTRSVVQELKLELEKAEKEEQQARQDSDLAKLRVEEMEQGIADESSVASKAQLEVAKARHFSAVSELGSLKEEIDIMSKEYESLLREKDSTAKRAVDSVSKAKDVERKMEGLTIEVLATKELLESAHAAHLEAQEKKFDAAMARDQDVYNQEKELKMVEEEIERVRQQIDAADDVKTKLQTASGLQQDLRAEIAAYKDSNMGKRYNSDIQAAVDSAMNELEEVKSNIEKTNSEVKTLKIIVGSLQSELEREKRDLSDSKQRNSEESREERCTEIAKKLQEATREAEEAKSLAVAAREELRKAKEESEKAKTGYYAIESQLIKAKKEMDAARASEKLALAAIKALQETECANKIEDISSSPRSIIISVEEYYELSKQAHEVEEAANRKLAEIVSKIEVAKEEESRILENLEEVSRETAIRKVELQEAMGKVEKARDGKVVMDHELRKWRSENGNRSPEGGNKENLSKSKSALHKPTSFAFGEQGSSSSNVTTPETKKKKKRFFLLPKVFMFLSRKKSSNK